MRVVGAIVVAWLAALGAARAQVLELAPNGAVTRYDGPALFTEDGVTPLARVQAPRGARPPPSIPAMAALDAAADHAELSAALIEAVAWHESRLRAGVVSPAGAIGEMQLMPATARELGVDPYDTSENFRGGAQYLRNMLIRYDGDVTLALAAYNAGPAAVDRYRGVPPYRETQAYVAAILQRLSERVAP